MSQIIDTYLRKLSTPVDILDISPKACRSLQRAGITTVAEIVLAGKPKIDSLKMIGPQTVEEIWRVAASHLDLSNEQLELSTSLQEEAEPNTRENSILALPLPPSTLEAIWSLGICLIDDLVRLRTLQYKKFRFMSAEEIAAIDRALFFNRTRSALVRLLPWIGTVEKHDLPLLDYSIFRDQDLILQLPGIHEQAWTILERATMQFLNPAETGARSDRLSYARVQKMIKAAHERLHFCLFSLTIFLDHFEEQSKIFENGMGDGPLELEILITALLPDPTRSLLVIERQEVVRMILLVRSLIFYRVRWIWDEMVPKWRTFMRLSCLVIPDLKKCLYFRRMTRELERETKKNQNTAPVISILSKDIHHSSPENKPDWRRPLSRINDRAWLILELRTLQMVSSKTIAAQAGGISRERVRQIIKWTQEILQHNIASLSPLLDHLEEGAQLLKINLGSDPLRLEVLVRHLIAGPVDPDLHLEEQELRRLIVLVRSLVLYRSPWFWEEMEPRWRDFILLSCLAEPPLKDHEKVRLLLKVEEPVKKKDGYQDLVYAVLVKAGKPLHWSSLAEKVSQLKGGDHFCSRSMLSNIHYHKERFVRVGPGTYGLAEWGLRTPASYTHLIASILQEEGRPMSLDRIFEKVSGIRPVTWSSVNILLNTHYRFYKSILNTYGLRGWLPVNDRLDSPVADFLMEKPSSLKRVERARAKGLSINKVIRQDQWQQQ